MQNKVNIITHLTLSVTLTYLLPYYWICGIDIWIIWFSHGDFNFDLCRPWPTYILFFEWNLDHLMYTVLQAYFNFYLRCPWPVCFWSYKIEIWNICLITLKYFFPSLTVIYVVFWSFIQEIMTACASCFLLKLNS